MRGRRLKSGCLVLLAWLAAPPGQGAEGLIPPGQERLKINLGALLYRSETEVRIDGATRGTEFELEDVLGLDRDRSSLYGSIMWRFASRHRVSLSAFQVEREGQRAIDRELRIEDRVLPVSTVLRAESRTQFFIADYRYSFVKNESMELAGILGVSGGRYRFSFQATSPLVDIEKETTAPVPVLGASLDWFLSPRWTASAFLQGMEFDLGEIDARVYNLGVSAEYMFTRHLGAGLAFNLDAVRVELDKGSFHGRVGLSGSSLIGFLQARF
jgi:hypothetical protein